MVVAINATQVPESYLCRVQITGLTNGTRYDVMRRKMRYTGDGPGGAPRYSMPLPDRRAYWSSVAHRVGWPAGGTTIEFRDYDAPMRPFCYFVVPTTSGGPTDWDFRDGNYPLGRGTLDGDVMHLARAMDHIPRGAIVVRSTREQGLWSEACVYDMPDLRYTARGTELAVVGRQYPLFVSDTREARRGSVVLTCKRGDYSELRRIVYPGSGRISPVIFDSFGHQELLLDDMTAIPLDVSVQPATRNDGDLRFVTVDYVESDPTRPHDQRPGDNDNLTVAPEAHMMFSDTSPRVGQWITVTDTSTGAIDQWHWTWYSHTDNPTGHDYGPGPHSRRWTTPGDHSVKLRVISPTGEVDVAKRTLTVRR